MKGFLPLQEIDGALGQTSKSKLGPYWFNHIRWLSIKVKFIMPFGKWECGNHTKPCATHLPVRVMGVLYTSLWQHLQESSTLGPERWAPCSSFIFYFVCAINLRSHSNKNKMSIDTPFFSSIMQFGKLFDHEMFLFLIKRCFKLIYKRIFYLRSVSHQPINLKLFDMKLLEKLDFKNVVFNPNSNQSYLAI